MSESDNQPPPEPPSGKPPEERKPTANEQAIEDLSWDVPFFRTIWNFFIREGKAVKNGWVAVLIIVGIAVWGTRSCTSDSFKDNILDLKGQLFDAKQDRDKFQIMLAPFQAAALKIYTNEPVDKRLDFLAQEINESSSLACIFFAINNETNLVEDHTPPGSVFQINTTNIFIINEREIKTELINMGRFPAVNAFVEIFVPNFISITNLNLPGWLPQLPSGQFNVWRYNLDSSIPQYFCWNISTIELSSSLENAVFPIHFEVGANNSPIKNYFVLFTVKSSFNKSDTNIIDKVK